MKTLLLSLLLIVASTMQAQQTTKQLILNQPDLKIYAYPNSVIIEDEYVTLWVERRIFSASDRTYHTNMIIEYTQLFDTRHKIDVSKWQKLQYIIDKVCVDVSDKTYKSEISIYYDSAGNVLYTYEYKHDGEWNEFVPGSIYATVYDYAKKLHKQKAPQ